MTKYKRFLVAHNTSLDKVELSAKSTAHPDHFGSSGSRVQGCVSRLKLRYCSQTSGYGNSNGF